jgi:hypothetical protein
MVAAIPGPDSRMNAAAPSRIDFFISRAGADAGAAELIAGIVREAGLAPFYQNEDFGPADFMRRMEQGYEGERTIALLSPQYQQSEYCRAEYNHVLGKDPANLRERLIVLRVAPCDPVGSLQNLAYSDLVPVLSDRAALARVVRAAIGIDRRASELQFWQPLRGTDGWHSARPENAPLLRKGLRARPPQVPRPARGPEQLRHLLVDMLRIAKGALPL